MTIPTKNLSAKITSYRHGCRRYRPRGVLLITAIVIALLMMLWVVAALARTRSQTATVLQSYKKSQSIYLAKTGMSYALYRANVDPSWLDTVVGANPDGGSGAQAWEPVAGAKVWATSGVGGQLTLYSRALIGDQQSEIKVPLKKITDLDSSALSVTKSTNNQSVIARGSITGTGWDSLPPLPGLPTVLSVGGTDGGDIYAAVDKPNGVNVIWRYRLGRGWMELIDPPEDGIKEIHVAKSSRLVTSTSDRLMVLPLDADMTWKSVRGPAHKSLDRLALPVANPSTVYALTDEGGQSELWAYNLPSDPSEDLTESQWQQGPSLPAGVQKVNGGLGADSTGRLYLAVNHPGNPSVIYRQKVDGSGWDELPPLPFFQWEGANNDVIQGDPSPVTQIDGIQVDEDNFVWVHAQQPGSKVFANIRIQNI